MSDSPINNDHLLDLAGAVCNRSASENDLVELDSILRADPVSRVRYLDYCEMHASLRLQMRARRAAQKVHQEISLNIEPTFPAPSDSDLSKGEVPSTMPFSFLSNTIHGPVGNLSGWPVAYLIATVIFGIGLVIGSITYVSHSVQVAQDLTPATKSQALPERENEFIGRITGMIDCRWTDESTAAINGAHVPLGRNYSLSSGLMEITYNTGAKVVLQGPVTYEVESKDGGYLSVGRLTAKVENKVASGQRPVASKSETPNHSQSTTRHPLFTIKTPTVIITDLGTKFGVEVDQWGGTKSHVFQGMVEVQLAANNGQLGKKIRLGENESVSVEKQQGVAEVKIVRGMVDSAIFVHTEQLPKLAQEHILKPLRRWQTYSEQLRKDPALVAYYTFDSVPQGDTKILRNLSTAGSKLDGQIKGAEWVVGRLPGKYALLFHGLNSADKVVLPQQDRFNFTGSFSVAVWFKVRNFTLVHQPLITKGDHSWRLQRCDSMNTLRCASGDGDANIHRTDGQTPVVDQRWHLAVAVFEPEGNMGRQQLYIDGCLDAETHASIVLNQDNSSVLLGAIDRAPHRTFDGIIDEVAILSRVMSAEEVMAMFNAGNPDK